MEGELWSVFEVFDRDQDGMINKKDLYHVLKETETKSEAKRRLQSIFLNIDNANTGTIHYS